MNKVRVLFKQHHHLLQHTTFECTAPLNSMRDCGDGVCIDWYQRHVVRAFSPLCRLTVSSTGRS